MWPKEHGAYGQVTFPLVTALAVTGVTWPSVLIALAVVALFLAHEPLLVLLGHRGRRARDADERRAWIWLKAALIVATAAGIIAIDRAAADVRWTFLIPVVPAAALFYIAIKGREKTSAGETVAAIAFASAAFPMCAAAGYPAAGAAIALAFALLFVLATLAVRVVVLRTRGGGNPRAARATRLATFAVGTVGVVIATAAVQVGVLPWNEVAAMVPGILFAAALAAFPPPAARLKKVGWTLVAVSALTSVLLIAAA